MQRTTYIRFALAAGMAASTLIAIPALAQTTSTSQQGAWQGGQGGNGQHMARPGVFGTVSAVNGSTLTVTSMARSRPGASTGSTNTTGTQTTYTVDAGSAKVTKAGAASSLSAVVVGDRVSVQGTVTGTNVAATAINDGIPAGMMGGRGGAMAGFKGNGEPVVGGTVSALNGSTFTVTNSGTSAYSIDASNATVMVKGATSTMSAIASGDKVLVQGTISGQNVTAATVIDQGQPKTSTTSGQQGPGGIMAGIGGFFKKLFSFF